MGICRSALFKAGNARVSQRAKHCVLAKRRSSAIADIILACRQKFLLVLISEDNLDVYTFCKIQVLRYAPQRKHMAAILAITAALRTPAAPVYTRPAIAACISCASLTRTALVTVCECWGMAWGKGCGL
eukprot:g18769.t1